MKKDKHIEITVKIEDITLGIAFTVNKLNPLEEKISNTLKRIENSLKVIIDNDLKTNKEFDTWIKKNK